MAKRTRNPLWDQGYEAGAEEAKSKIARALAGVGYGLLKNDDGKGDPTDGYVAAVLISMADTLDQTDLVMLDGQLHKSLPRASAIKATGGA